MPEPQPKNAERRKLVKVKDLGVVAFPFHLSDDKIVAAIRTHRGQTHAAPPHFTGKTTEESEHARLMATPRSKDRFAGTPVANVPQVTPDWNTLRQAVYKATEPVLMNPNTTPTADTWAANRDAAWNAAANAANVGGNVLKRAGRFMFGLVDLVPQVVGIVKNLYSPDERVSAQAEADLLSLHPGAQIADRLKEAVQDWRRSKSLAAENLLGDLLGFYLVGKIGGKVPAAEKARLQQMGVVLPPEAPAEPLGLPAPAPPTIEGTLSPHGRGPVRGDPGSLPKPPRPAPLPSPAGLRPVEVTANLSPQRRGPVVGGPELRLTQPKPVSLAELRKEAAMRRPQAKEQLVAQQTAKPWKKSGAELGTLYHGSKVKVGEIDLAQVGQRDSGLYGRGFYMTEKPKWAKTYGPRVTEKQLRSDAQVLDVGTIHPQYEQKVNPALQTEIEGVERQGLQQAKNTKDRPEKIEGYLEMIRPQSPTFNLGMWIAAVHRYAEMNGYDVIRFSPAEVIVKNANAVLSAPAAVAAPAAMPATAPVPSAMPVTEPALAATPVPKPAATPTAAPAAAAPVDVAMNLTYKGAGGTQPFYLKSEKLLGEKMKGPMPAGDIAKMLLANGVKPEEMKWTGMEEFLKEKGEAKVTPEEMRQHLAANNLELKEVRKGEGSITLKRAADTAYDKFYQLAEKDFGHEAGAIAREIQEGGQSSREIIAKWMRDTGHVPGEMPSDDLLEAARNLFNAQRTYAEAEAYGGPKFGTWVMPGGENYRELLVTLPENQITESDLAKYFEPGKIVEGYAGKDKVIAFHPSSEQRLWSVDVIHVDNNGNPLPGEHVRNHATQPDLNKLGKTNFRTSHWDEPNVLGHVRFNDRTGPNGEKLLHLEELQSDWHEKGRKGGYGSIGPPDTTGWKATKTEDHPESWIVADASGDQISIGGRNLFYGRTAEEAIADAARIKQTGAGRELRVPDAPFKKTWPELLLKRMIRYAAENGYDGISWTPGEEQAERYDLSKQIDRVAYQPRSDNRTALWITGKNGEVLQDTIGERIPGSSWDDSEKAIVVPNTALPDLVGKELTEKIQKGEGADSYGGAKIFSGLDLKVGGEGMKGFYDQMLPIIANKIGKPWDAKVDSIDLGGRQFRVERSPDLSYRIIDSDGVDLTGKNFFDTRSMAQHYADELQKVEPPGTVPYLPITPQMREGVTAQPLSLFNLIYKAPPAKPAEIADAWRQLGDIRNELYKMPPPEEPDLSTPENMLAWKHRHQEWRQKAQPWLDKYRAATGRIQYLENREIGEVRALPDGQKVLYLSGYGLRTLCAGIRADVNPAYTLNGASLTAWDVEAIGRIAEAMDLTFGKELRELLAVAKDKDGNVTVAAIPEKGQSLRASLGVLREELNHTWQKRFGDVGSGHLSAQRFEELNAAIPQGMMDDLRQNRYNMEASEKGNQIRVLETSSKLLSEAPAKFGLTEDEAAVYLFQYFDAVEKEHGPKALEQLIHITRLGKQIKEDFIHGRQGTGGGAEDRGTLGRVQERGASRDQGGPSPARRGAPEGEGTAGGGATGPGITLNLQQQMTPVATGVAIHGVRADADKVVNILEGAKKRNPLPVGSNLPAAIHPADVDLSAGTPAAPKPIKTLWELRQEATRRRPHEQTKIMK